MPGGRPKIIDETTLKVLEDAFSNGASDIEACFLADISNQTLYNYQKENPEYLERKRALKDMIKYQAKVKVKNSIDKELGCDTAKWYLERRDKEFKPKSDLTTDNQPLPLAGFNYVKPNTDNFTPSETTPSVELPT